MLDELATFMDRHNFASVADFKGHSLQYFTTHHDLVRRQAEARTAASKATAASLNGQAIAADHEWSGDEFVNQSDALARG
jgi:hypothetical protein